MMNGSPFTRLHVADTEVAVKDNVAHAPGDERGLLFPPPSLRLLQREARPPRRFVARPSVLNFSNAAKTQKRP